MNHVNLKAIQFWALLFISIFFILNTPEYWQFTPDSGIYVGTAESLVNTGQYYFNNYPNLLYYPGTSSLLSIPIAIFGTNFYILHLYTLLLVLASLWLCFYYFSYERYGIAGLLLPFILVSSSIYQFQLFSILSDGIFLTLSITTLLLWRKYIETDNKILFITCAVLVAISPLFRFHGLFLCLAFVFAYILHKTTLKTIKPNEILKKLSISALIFLPFLFWTFRNYMLHTPETYNMANRTFFGLKGLLLYDRSSHFKAEWIDADWKYGVYNTLFSIQDLAEGILGKSITSTVSLEVVFLLTITIIALGILKWFNSANRMEQAYVIVSILFLFKASLSAKSLYTVDRYWLLTLPFIIISASYGTKFIYQKISQYKSAAPATLAIYGITIVFIFSSGITNALSKSLANAEEFYKSTHLGHLKVAHFISNNTEKNDTIATTDWGVMPRYIKRTSYPILNDKNHVKSLQRILKYKTKFLIIRDENSTLPKAARKMVNEYPTLFTSIYMPNTGKHGAKIEIFRIDLPGVENILHDRKLKK